jgi:hypothetical protein
MTDVSEELTILTDVSEELTVSIIRASLDYTAKHPRRQQSSYLSRENVKYHQDTSTFSGQ